MPSGTLLSQIRQLVTVDVDSMDPAHAARHTSPEKGLLFCDMTSNQAILGGQAERPENLDLVKEAIQEVKTSYEESGQKKKEGEEFAMDVIDVLTVLVAKRVYPYLSGNVHAQTSPCAAYDIERTVAHATKLVKLFEKHGISKSRVCIKIPTSAESMVACHKLKQVGIQTLATCLFSVPQALAASQAGCIYVAPYFNELRVHFQPTLWREYANPGKEHPMSQVVFDVKDVYKKIGSKTMVMPASLVTCKEIIGLVSLKPDHITISGGLLDKLAELPPEPVESFQLDLAPTQFSESELSADYLANDGALLKESLAKDAETTRKLDDALKIFDECEKKTKDLILSIASKA
ncbi:aldolase [Dendrothele bispora CBS 962.96]|uniref:Aldolase n=1 Tax=Dendrothele bispora (strain CBS 962.96) TaxID=1314807 RepID=A0A4S8M6S2_DENBC|nr:aldolase [Dendrothele bispora CBS 962.96]